MPRDRRFHARALAALTVITALAAACGSSSGNRSGGDTTTTVHVGAVAPDRVDLAITGAVTAKISGRDDNNANHTIAQDVACYPPDSDTHSLNCQFGGVYDGGTADASLTVDGYHGPGTYPVGQGLDIMLTEANVDCSGTGGTVKVDELPPEGTSQELDARIDFSASLDCSTPGGTQPASLAGSIEAHPCLATADTEPPTTATATSAPGRVCGN